MTTLDPFSEAQGNHFVGLSFSQPPKTKKKQNKIGHSQLLILHNQKPEKQHILCTFKKYITLSQVILKPFTYFQ